MDENDLQNPFEKCYQCVKEFRNARQNKQGLLVEGDIIKLGRVRLRIKRLVREENTELEEAKRKKRKSTAQSKNSAFDDIREGDVSQCKDPLLNTDGSRAKAKGRKKAGPSKHGTTSSTL